jgi:hypothetical protein
VPWLVKFMVTFTCQPLHLMIRNEENGMCNPIETTRQLDQMIARLNVYCGYAVMVESKQRRRATDARRASSPTLTMASAPSATPSTMPAALAQLQTAQPGLLEQINKLLAEGKLTSEQLARVRARRRSRRLR